MNTNVWGPHLWSYLHCVAFNYCDNPSPEQKENIYNFLKSVKDTMPCKYCRTSYAIFFKHLDLHSYLDDRMGVTYWLYILHNLVNLKLKKPPINFYDNVVEFEKIRADKADYSYHDFAIKANDKYKNITKNYIKNLLKDPESPIK